MQQRAWWYFFVLYSVFNTGLISSCHSINKSSKNDNSSEISKYLSKESEQEIYQFLLSEMAELQAKKNNELKIFECQCRSGFKRELTSVDESLRFDFDRGALRYLLPFKNSVNELRLFFFGSGRLKQELTIIARLAQAGFSIKVFLMDNAYAFYEDPHMESKIKSFKDKKEEIQPEWLKGFWIWGHKEMDEKKTIDFFKEHNESIDEFKVLTRSLGKKYNVTVDVEIFADESQARMKLNSQQIHGYFAVDSFLPPSAIAWRVSRDLMDGTPKRPISEEPYRLLFFLLNKDRYGLWLPEDDKNDAPTRFEVWQSSIDLDQEIHLKMLYRKEDKGGKTSDGLHLTTHPLHLQ